MNSKSQQIQFLLNTNIPFVCFHLPQSEKVHFFFENEKDNIKDCKSSNCDNVFELVSWCKKQTILHAHTVFELPILDFNTFEFDADFGNCSTTVTSKENFIAFIEKIKSNIAHSDLKKVVASRIKEIEKPAHFSVFKCLKKIIKNYPNAFAYCFYLPHCKTCWIGASPETLLTYSHTKAQTMALAGTQAFGHNIQWSAKEYHEQDLVVQQISNTLAQQNLSFQTSNLQTVRAANLAHLCTQFQIHIDPQTSIKTLLDALHPTPAVGGLPKQLAVDFINQHEGYERSFYTGYLGVKGIENKNYYFVNLRCMQVFNKHLALYVGAGITASSVAEKEWNETELKAQTMLNIVNSNDEM